MEDELLTYIGQTIRTLRKKQGVSMEYLADRANIHLTYLAQIEKGSRNISVKTLWQIAAALNIKPVSLLPENRQISARDNYLNRIAPVLNKLEPQKKEIVLHMVKELSLQLAQV
ncbi:MAG: helix-turn-helix domain-containing protein [Candidatus Margulisbacteria bacterium]|jgi:transcriptional regulator with XRE-family HTH domain|nr:helix-turn-helix domain-containing protein [Candidatus Margulisiibacteriota bacterium]